jgi:ferredoxin
LLAVCRAGEKCRRCNFDIDDDGVLRSMMDGENNTSKEKGKKQKCRLSCADMNLLFILTLPE